MRIYGSEGVRRLYLEGLAVSDHSSLSGRSSADSHPISAITDLQTDLDAIDVRLDALEAAGTVYGTGIADNAAMIAALSYFLGE